MKQVKIYISVILSVILLNACSDFDEINENPDTPTTVPASMLATYIVKSMVEKGGNKTFINDGVLIKQITWNEGVSDLQYNNLGRWGLDNFTIIVNCNDMVSKTPENKLKGYEGLAHFAKAYTLYYASLNLGDIPYAGVGFGEIGNVKPKYDMQKDVMLAILDDLDKAYTSFSEAEKTAFDGDIIFKGDKESWKKVITAFHLKVLINLSKKESDTDLNIKSRFADIVKNKSLMQSNKDNFQLTYKDQSGMRYPFNDLTTNQCKYAMLSSVLVDILKKYEDYRLFYFGEPSAAKIKEGIKSDNYDAYIGVDPSIPFGEVSKAHGAKLYCSPNLRYTSTEHPVGEPMVKIGYGEQQLILAEACLRGWITGNVSDYFKEGIKANMGFVRDITPEKYAHNRVITDTYISSYIDNPELQLSGSFDSKLNKIIEQKYVAYFLQHAYEAYYDYRRTGYPVLPINPGTSMNSTAPDKIPVRYRYSADEYSYNRENLEEAIKRQYNDNDNNNELMWILK